VINSDIRIFLTVILKTMMLQSSLKRTSDSENLQSKCTVRYAYEIVGEQLISKIDESLVRA